MEQLTCKNIIFCFPYKGVGGVSVLFLRLSNLLQKLTGKNVYLLDYADGYMALHNQNNQVSLLKYSDDIKTEIPEDSLVILQSMTPWSIFPQISFRADTKLFFWNCHPFNLVPLMPGIRNWIAQYPKLIWFSHKTILLPYNLILKKFYSILITTKSIAFMDIDNLEMTEFVLSQKLYNSSFLPIPVDVPKQNLWVTNSPNLKDKALNCGWIGRVADFKHTILKRTIIELKKFAESNKKQIHFTLVGSGEYIHELDSELSSTEYFKYTLVNEVPPQNLDSFILSKFDILFSMGTSALESAKLGVPTVLLDFSYGPVSEFYSYKFIYDTKGFSLGKVITSELCSRKNSIDSILAETLNQPEKVSEKCYNYTLQNHDIQNIGAELLNKVSQSELTYGTLLNNGIFNKSIIYKLFKKLRRR